MLPKHIAGKAKPVSIRKAVLQRHHEPFMAPMTLNLRRLARPAGELDFMLAHEPGIALARRTAGRTDERVDTGTSSPPFAPSRPGPCLPLGLTQKLPRSPEFRPAHPIGKDAVVTHHPKVFARNVTDQPRNEVKDAQLLDRRAATPGIILVPEDDPLRIVSQNPRLRDDRPAGVSS